MNHQIHGIAFADDAILLDYTDTADRSPFERYMQIRIPFAAAQLHPQVAQDMQELMQDAQTLLDSVLAARVSSPTIQEMGRQ